MNTEFTFVENFITILKNQSGFIIDRLQPTCLKVIFSLMVIDLTLEVLFDSGEENIFMKLIRKSLAYGAYITFITNYKTIINEYVLKGFIQLGNYISTGQPITTFITSPSEILGKVLNWIAPAFFAQGIANTTLDAMGIESIPILSGLLLLFLAGLALGITCGMVMLFAKFYIITSCAIVLIPFAVFKETKSIGKGVLQLIIKQGVSIMVMVLILNMLGDSFNFTGKITPMRTILYIGKILVWFMMIKEVSSLTNQIFGGYITDSNYGNGVASFSKGHMGTAFKQLQESTKGAYEKFRNAYKNN